MQPNAQTVLGPRMAQTMPRQACFHSTPLGIRHRTRHTATCAGPQDVLKSTSTSTKQASIEGLQAEYCDEFVCTSSPAVESSIRTLARDLKRASWTPYVFARDVKYSDLLRSFKGSDGYNRNRFVADCVQQPKVSIINMRMLEGRGDAAEITWRLQGTINNIQFTATLVETITLNLVTGQITEHRSRWAIEQGGLAASLAYLLTRVSWSLRQGATDAGEAGNRALQSLTSIDEGDESQGTIMRNPNDPTKFFQQQDTFYQDAIGLLLFLAVMYTIFQGWNAVFQL